MKRQTSRAIAAMAAACVIALCFVPASSASAQTSSQVNAQIAQAYSSVLGAESSGGNVTSLVAELNSAISLVQQADSINATNPARAQSLYSQASALAQQVISAAPAVAAAGRAAVFDAQVSLAVETAVLGALAVLAYVYVPRLFWCFWLRTHRGWRVKKR